MVAPAMIQLPRSLSLFAVVVLGLSAVGCAIPERPVVDLVTPRFAVLLGEDCSIEAEDASFSIVSGAEGTSVPETDVVAYPDQNWTTETLLDNYERLAQLGGTPVRVQVPSREQPLYGHLIFFRVFDSAGAGAKRTWRIEIPEHQVRAAEGGLISAVFQPYEYEDYDWNEDAGAWQPAELTAASWMLFLSDNPL